GLVGESGSGKSVLGRTIMGLTTTRGTAHVSGQVLFAGRDIQAVSSAERRKLFGMEIGMVFQDPMTALNPFKKIGTHITESLKVHLNLGKNDARERAIELLRKVGIPEPSRRVDQYPHELSGGMRQRVVIAMALACDPVLLIADEPTTALDVTVQQQILDLLEALNRELGMSIILISHDLGVIAGRADRVAVMYAGNVVETAATADLFTSPRHPYTEALLAAIPGLDDAVHTRLETIPGNLPDMTRPIDGCVFAARCRYAQSKCLTDAPVLHTQDDLGGVATESGHAFACHYPVGTPRGEAALTSNQLAGRTAAGLSIKTEESV
ncbi:MAG: ABC transporter ATP-binding protein, partial [Mycobacteriaceae bacterium]